MPSAGHTALQLQAWLAFMPSKRCCSLEVRRSMKNHRPCNSIAWRFVTSGACCTDSPTDRHTRPYSDKYSSPSQPAANAIPQRPGMFRHLVDVHLQAVQADVVQAQQASAACHASAALLNLSQKVDGPRARPPSALMAPAVLAALRKLLVRSPSRPSPDRQMLCLPYSKSHSQCIAAGQRKGRRGLAVPQPVCTRLYTAPSPVGMFNTLDTCRHGCQKVPLVCL